MGLQHGGAVREDDFECTQGFCMVCAEVVCLLPLFQGFSSLDLKKKFPESIGSYFKEKKPTIQ